MLKKSTRLAMIAVLAVFGLLAVAAAQSRPPAPPSPKLNVFRAGNGASVGTVEGKPSPQWSLGWNYVHIANCTVYINNAGFYLFVYPVEGGYFYTALPEFKELINPSCQSGNWIAFYVTDSYGDWDQVWTYTYR